MDWFPPGGGMPGAGSSPVPPGGGMLDGLFGSFGSFVPTLDFGSAASSSTGPIYTSGVKLSRGVDPVLVWVGLGLGAWLLLRGK